MQKLTQDKGLVSKCKYRSRLVLIELTRGIRLCESNSPYYKISLHCHNTNTAVMLYCFHGVIFTGVLNPGQLLGGGGWGVWHEVEQTNCIEKFLVETYQEVISILARFEPRVHPS